MLALIIKTFFLQRCYESISLIVPLQLLINSAREIGNGGHWIQPMIPLQAKQVFEFPIVLLSARQISHAYF
jgi:hypothetical protein